ncbi:MAG TPA: hypothetical protein VFB48_02940, partial [Nitrososphaeraceae archaeon]|nr:hypothetical protein [Nitrososphaeraceae archaeon]
MIGPLKLGLIAAIFLLFYPIIAINGQSIVHEVIKTKNSERFVVDYNASNTYRRQPLVYNFSESIPTNWQLTI